MAVPAGGEEALRVKCSLCNLSYEPSAGRMHGRKFQCVPCASADRLLRRGLGDKSELQSLPVAEQHAFFCKLHAERKANPDSRLNWQTVRAQLVSTLTTRQLKENSTTINQEFLPLSVWVTRGWDEETVKRNNSEWNEGLQCWTYQIPVKSKTWKEAYQEVEERLVRQEREASLKRGGKKNKEGEDGAADAELDVPSARAEGKGEPSASAEKKAAKAEAAAQRKVAGTNQKLQILAARAVAPLAQDLLSVQKLRQRVTADLPEGIERTYTDSVEKLRAWNTAAKLCLSQWDDAKVASGETGMTPLPFDQAELKCLHKTVAEVQSSLKVLLPAPKAKAASQKRAHDGGSDKAAEADAEPRKRRRAKSTA